MILIIKILAVIFVVALFFGFIFAANYLVRLEEKAVEDYVKERDNRGMWCRMCGGPCDMENCGMEQP